MVPESSSSNQIRLYECIQFPMKWKFKCTLMDNISAVDTILIKTRYLVYVDKYLLCKN